MHSRAFYTLKPNRFVNENSRTPCHEKKFLKVAVLKLSSDSVTVVVVTFCHSRSSRVRTERILRTVPCERHVRVLTSTYFRVRDRYVVAF